MDPSLLRDRERFKQRALATPAVEKRKNREDDSKPNKKSRPTANRPPPSSSHAPFNYKGLSGSSQNKFVVLAKIVKYMKTKHQYGDTYPLTIDEILDETNQLDVGPRVRHWLSAEALLSNPKIDVVDGNKFKFKPNYNIKDRKALLRLLDKQDQSGLGGILLDDVEEALPRCDKALKHLGDAIVHVMRPQDKKKILFYNDKSYQFAVDEELVKLWRSVTVEGIDENKIEDHLEKQGIASMQDIGPRKPVVHRRKKFKGKRRMGKSHNEHMGDILQDYSDKT